MVDDKATSGERGNCEIPFRPTPRDFSGFPMPASVPEGMKLELSRARLLDGTQAQVDGWMTMLNDRYEECVATLPQERGAFESIFVNEEADGSRWMYHLVLAAADSPGLIENNALDRDHAACSRATKMPGWEELQPKFLLCTPEVRSAVERAGRGESGCGKSGCGETDVAD